MTERAIPPTGAARRRYARWLRWGTRASLAALVLAFGAYATGLVAPNVAIQDLPQLWVLPSGEYLLRAHIQPGWGWATLGDRAELLNLAGIALLGSCSIPCLASAIPIYRARGQHALAVICAVEIAVLLLAASGVLAGGGH